jgi:uncharacterized membrane protein
MTDQAGRAGRADRAARTWRGRGTMSALVVAMMAGVLAAAATVVAGGWMYAPAIGWDVTALVFCSLVWMVIWPMSAKDTARRATEEDPSRANTDLLVLSASVASLAAVTVVLVHAHAAHGATEAMLAGLGLLSVAVSWFTVHTVFTLRYALLYYTEPEGGIDFKMAERPCYRDFAYVALTLGMTFQVSDTDLRSTQMRATALRHALLSYLFGAVILAVAINLVAGLGGSG